MVPDKEGRDLWIKKVEVGSAIQAGDIITLAAGRVERVNIYMGPHTATIAGSAANSNRKLVVTFPVDERRWQLVRDAPDFAAVRAAEDLSFRVGGLPAGSYFVGVVDDAMERTWRHHEALRRLAPHCLIVTIRDGEEISVNLR